MKLCNTPYIHCKIRNQFLGIPGTFTECYIFMLTALPNRPILFTAHTEHGGVFSRLPIWAFAPMGAKFSTTPTKRLQKWSVLGSETEVISPPYLKDYRVKSQFGEGVYKFTIDFTDGMFSEDPEQHKSLHFIELEETFALLPNNECRFVDSHFVGDTAVVYKRNTEYFTTEE